MSKINDKIVPFFMYGTAWKEDRTENLVFQALQSGFRAIDTANQRKHYYEEGVGKGIGRFLEGSELDRKDLFIQTKFTYQGGQDHRLPYDPKADFSTQVEQSFQSSLEHLKIDFLDSYVLHGPSTSRGLHKRDFEVWKAMEKLHTDGVAHHIGVSNINPEQLKLLLDKAEVKPEFVQNRCYAQLGWDKIVREICKSHDIIYQGFSLLTANRSYIVDPRVKQIADVHGLTIQGTIFSFAKQIGILPLTGTTNEDHMTKDLAELNYELTEDEIRKIEKIANN